MLRFRSLASSSSGNATLVEASDGTRHTRVLVDCGLGWRQLQQRLAQAGTDAAALDAVFITHEHGDHVGCLATLLRRHGTPVWTSAGTWDAMRGLDGHTFNPVADGATLAIGALQLRPFTVPHDAREPLQLGCSDGNRKLGILTDLGHATPHVAQQLSGCHALLLESNHDPDLLARSRYPDFLKRRIGGMLGHLSNAQAGKLLQALAHKSLNTVVAAHLSVRNNRPELAQAALAAALGCGTGDIRVATQDGMDWISV